MKARALPPSWLTVLLIVVCVGILALSAFGYRATLQWQRSSALLIERQRDDGALLLVTAVTRDMRGVQSSVLADRDWGDFSSESPFDVTDLIEAAFARYPYPESFFSWQAPSAHGVTFFNRADRLPGWMRGNKADDRYPVVFVTDPPESARLRRQVEAYAGAHRRYAVFNTAIGSEPYQIVARLTYKDALLEHLQSVAGFTVNLSWVRHAYFSELVSQVSRIVDSGGNLNLAVADDRGQVVFGSGAAANATQRQFPLLFVDPATGVLNDPTNFATPIWTVRVSAKSDSPLVRTTERADRLLLAAGAAVCALVAGLVLILRAVRAGVALAEMRSDFVASVTHDLRTPLASIRALADTLVHRPHIDSDTIRDYAQLMTQETKRLTRRVDNLLAYARVIDVTEVYSFEPIAPIELVDDVLNDFKQQIAEGACTVEVDVHTDLPLILGDRTSLMLALGNLIDNAIRYSDKHRLIRITARRRAHRVIIEVGDRGIGIPTEELSSVQRKFVRGRLARADGSGLGLAIVNRVMADHGGSFVLESELGSGTVARVLLPTGD
jgi:signal transduction histidine kinase